MTKPLPDISAASTELFERIMIDNVREVTVLLIRPRLVAILTGSVNDISFIAGGSVESEAVFILVVFGVSVD